MRIIFSGAHGVGKTTLISALLKTGAFDDYEVQPSARSRLIQLGIDHSKNGTEDTQFHYMEHVLEYQNHKNIICDRGVYDVLGYTQSLYARNRLSKRSLCQQLKLVADYAEKVNDLIFFIPPEFQLVDDQFRSMDPDYQMEISDCIERALKIYGASYITIGGTLEERLSEVCLDILAQGIDFL